MTPFAWHVHHDRLIEPLTEPIEARIAHVKATKPEAEQALRLRLLKPVRGKVPAKLDEARAAYDKAWAAYDKAWAAYGKAWAARDKAWAAYGKAWAARDRTAIERLHASECPGCPWDGQTIFPKAEVPE